ncbi:uncharacterized protein [Primulina huaijiensis]|uniref:uncharacterized protein n=1 Tax=Primulina huaijiensis TaxID=1492673 RepID=UPI003CC75E39
MGEKKATNKSAEASTSNKCRRTRNKKKSKQGTNEKSKQRTNEKYKQRTNEKSKQETTAEDKPIHDFHEKKSGKEYFSRCSPPYFKTVMRELKPILGEQHMSRINDTPLAKWIDMPVLAISSGRIDYFLNRFQGDSCSFFVGDNITITFKSADFSIVLGLHHIGQPVDLDLKLESKFLTRHFDGKVTKANRIGIYEKLIFLARSDDECDIDDFVRTFILFIFNCIIFPTGNYITPGFIFPYLDDLTIFFKYAWGDVAFRFLYREICQIGKKLYVDGCTVGLMVLSIHPFCEEEKLLVDMNLVLNQETNRSEVKRFEKLVMKQMNDLKILRKRCAELEGEKVRRRMKGKRSVADKRDNVVESEEKVDKTEEKMTFESPHDSRANFGDFVDVVVNAVVSDLAKKKKELDESHSLNASVTNFSSNIQ